MASTPEGGPARTAQRARRPKLAPLSFSQERMWFLDQWSPGTATFNIPLAVRLSGRLDAEALRHSLREIANRHDALRTTFTESAEGRLLQVIAPTVEVSLPVVEVPEREAWDRLNAEA